jgi:DNA-binding LacI/PurR family transcriptional regulator
MRISPKSTHRVLDAAQSLNYLGNYHAQNLARGTAMTIGLVTPYFDRDMFRPAVTVGVIRRARQAGYEVLNVSAENGLEAHRRALRYVQQGRLDGVVVFMGEALEDGVGRSAGEAMAVAYVWFAPSEAFPMVTIDPDPGIRQAVAHLAALGHRKALWLGVRGPTGIELPDRLDCFRRAAAAEGVQTATHFLPLDISPAVIDGRTISAFAHALLAHAPSLEDSTAVCCYNDNMALALSLLLSQRGGRVPEDLSIVGFDDLQAFQGVPPLSTVSHMFREMGEKAVELVLEMAADPERCATYSRKVFRVPTRFVIRQSTGPAPDARRPAPVGSRSGSP